MRSDHMTSGVIGVQDASSDLREACLNLEAYSRTERDLFRHIPPVVYWLVIYPLKTSFSYRVGGINHPGTRVETRGVASRMEGTAVLQ